MAHIILKTSKTLKDTALAVQDNAPPIIIDFSKTNKASPAYKNLLIAFCVLASFFIASLLALFVLAQQLNNLWHEAIPRATTPIISAPTLSAPIPSAHEPAAAFPATALIPLPSKALILGKDFQQTKNIPKNKAKNIDLVPILERLPLYEIQKPRDTRNTAHIAVETAHSVVNSTALQEQADNAVRNGDVQTAIALYTKAIRLTPDDTTLRSNVVALLLDQARSYDEAEQTAAAINAYKKALSFWTGRPDTAATIRARIRYLETKLSD
jgi:tetratricopeptide (TPR) repeat protein